MKLIASFLIGYVFGNFQSSYIFVKLLKKRDIREIGSGNAGTMNTFLNVGETIGILVLFCDMLKTIIPAIICTIFFGEIDVGEIISICSLGVFLGHCFPFWLGFKGGKGVAVAVAFALTLDIRNFLTAVIVAGIFGILIKSATYGSYTFAIMLFVCAVDFGYGKWVVLSAFIQSLAIVLLHIRGKSRLVATK
ncbi:MAG: glycerol-3-phosphate acyltransferase [Clostridia bacterium]|nr:glycerol-3-phosphate acyltransferase [Clostridia bacterium]